jgi:hypothetical protein
VSFRLNRRTVLRGLGGVAIGLPFLEAMQPSRANAGGATAPKRLFIMYSSNGTVMRNWRPSATGSNFPISEILAPLDTSTLRPHLNVLSGIDMASAHKLNGNGHSIGMTNMLTGRPFTEIQGTEFGDVGWGSGISIDQEIARQVAAPGQLKSIELGVRTKEEYTNFYAYMSYGPGGGSAGAISADDDPRSAFDRLFSTVPDNEAARAELEKRVAQRKSVLDFVQDDFKRINGRLGKSDQTRLDKHLTLIRDLEMRIKVGNLCEKPDSPTLADNEVLRTSMMPTVGKMHMDLLAAAMACDITRVGNLQWANAQCGVVYDTWIDTNWDDAPDRYHHGVSHAAAPSDDTWDAGQTRANEKLSLINNWYAKQFAYFGEALASYEELDGTTLLDNTVMLWVSEISEGPSHRFTDIPCVMLGNLGGTLKANQHINLNNDRSTNDLFITIGQAMGLTNFNTFGDPEFVNGPIAELLT